MATSTVTEAYAGYPNGAPAGHTHVESGASSVSSGLLLTTGLTSLQRGGATLDASGGGLVQRVRAHSKLVIVTAGGVPAGGIVSKYATSGGALTFLGFRATCAYQEAAIAVNCFVTMTVEGSRAAGSFSTFSNFNIGVFLSTSDEVVMEMRYTPGVGLANGTIEYRAYRQGGTVPSYVSFAVHSDYAVLGGPGGILDLADASGSNTKWVSLETETTVPDAPTVTVSSISHFTGSLSGSAFADSNAGGTHAASQFRVRRTSDDAILYGPTLVSSASTGPHTATGLPAATSGLVGEIRYKDQYGLWGVWGTSSSFATLGPPTTPTVTVSKIRRTTAYITGSAYSNGGSGAAHAATQVKVIRSSDSTVLYGPVTLGAVTGRVAIATGLPDGPSGAGGRPINDPDYVAEVRYQDADGLWSAWGLSSLFQTLNLWESGEYITHVDLLVERIVGGDTVMQSYSDFAGRNWIKAVKVDPAGVDSPIGSGSASLHRAVEGDSLAPLVTLSPLNMDGLDYAPALDFGREVQVIAAISAPGEDPDTGDYVTLLRGITDDIEWPRKAGDITVPFRDYSGRLADTMMRSEQRYGSEEGVDAIEVMQDYVDVHMGAGQYTITDQTTGDRFNVTDWTPSDVYVLEGLQQVALMWGGKDLRQVEDADEALLAVIEPDREKTDADYSIGPYTYIDVNAINTAGKFLRTIVRGRAVDKETGETLVSQLPAEEDVGTDPLVSLYGPLFFQFDEEQAKGIDTQEELDAMVAAIYADLSTPPIPLEIETKFCPFAKVGDLVEWLPDTILRDESLKTAVLTLSHSCPSPGVGRTIWRCAGKPKGRYSTYQHLGVEVAGIGKRPTIFSVALVQDGTTLTATSDFNAQIVLYSIYARTGSSPKVDGFPVEGTAKGTNLKATDRAVSWSVRDGLWYVLVRGFAENGRFVDYQTTVTVTGVGGPGTGSVAPTDIPGTPAITLGAVVGGDREASIDWVNTDVVDDIELETILDGVSEGITPVAPGVDSSTGAWPLGSTLVARLRYTAGSGLEGAWSPVSRAAFISAGLP